MYQTEEGLPSIPYKDDGLVENPMIFSNKRSVFNIDNRTDLTSGNGSFKASKFEELSK